MVAVLLRCRRNVTFALLLLLSRFLRLASTAATMVAAGAMPQEVPAVDPTEPGAAVKKRPSTTHAKKVEASLAKNHVPENYFVVPALFKENENN